MPLNRILWRTLLLAVVVVAGAYYANSAVRESTYTSVSTFSSGYSTRLSTAASSSASTSGVQISTTSLGVIAGETWSYGCPAQQEGQQCGSPYPDYQVAIYNAATGQLVATVTSDSSGHFSLPVPPGEYVIYTMVHGGAPGTPGSLYGGPCAYPSTFNPSWTGCASSPQYFTVTSGQMVTVTVNIPNGIE
jgi:hypothetical protein